MSTIRVSTQHRAYTVKLDTTSRLPVSLAIIRTLFFFCAHKMRFLQRIPGMSAFFDLLQYGLIKVLVPELATSISEVESIVASWPNVQIRGHRFGGTEFRLIGADAEFGHIHGCGIMDWKFKACWKSALETNLASRILPHHIAPDSKTWATFGINSKSDIPDAINLLSLSYNAAIQKSALKSDVGNESV